MARKKLRVPERRPAGKGKPKKVIHAWGGFVDGKLYGWLSGFYDVEHLSVFETLADAKRCHEDVRRIHITVDDPQ
jgi:hypothetical protein